jgi:hypothetical protein
MSTDPTDLSELTDLSETQTGRWHRTVFDILIRDEIVAHQIVDYLPDGTVESRTVQRCNPCRCWQ